MSPILSTPAYPRSGHTRGRAIRTLLFLAAVSLLRPELAAADTIYQTAGNSNWSTATWSAGLPNTSTETAVFNQTTGAARTVTVNANYNIAGILFNGTTTPTTYTITRTGTTQTLTLHSTNAIISSSSAAQIVGGSALRFTLANATAFSVNGTGNLQINPNRITNAGLAITLNGTGAGNGNVSSNITGTGGLNVTAGNWTLGATSTYTGITSVTGGTLSIAAENRLGGNPGAFTANQLTIDGGTLRTTASFAIDDANRGVTLGAGGGTFDVTTGTLTLASTNIITGTGALTKIGTGTLLLNSQNTYDGGTTVTAGTLTLGHASNTLDDAGTVLVNGGTFAIGANSDTIGALTLSSGNITGSTGVLTASSFAFTNTATTVSAILGGSGTLTKTGAGTVTLSGVNTYSGLTTVTAGTLALGHATDTLDGDITINGGTLSIGANSDTVGTVTLSSGSITGSGGTLTGSSYSLTDSGTISAILGGSGTLTKTGAGTVTLSGVNTYSGLTTVTDGTLALGHATDTLDGDITVNGGTLSIGANSDTVGAVTLSSGSITGSGGTLTGSSYSLTDSGTISAILGGSGTLTKTGAGTVTLSGANTYSGLTTVTAGTLALGHATDTLDGDITVNGGTLSIGANSDTVGAVTLSSGSITGSGGTLTGSSYSLTDSGTISAILGGSGTLTKTGAGTVTLSGANTYTGATTINGGTLSFSADNNLGTAPGGVTPASITLGGGTLLTTADFTLNANRGITLTTATSSNVSAAPGTTLTYGGVIAGSGNIQFGTTGSGTGNIVLNAATSHTGSTTIGAGTLKYGVDNALSSATAVTINAGATLDLVSSNATFGSLAGASGSTVDLSGSSVSRTLTLGDSSNTSFAGAINDSGSSSTLNLVKQGTGTLSLSGASNFSGTVNVTAGTLKLENNSALGTGSADTTVSNGAVLNIDGGRTITRGLLDITGTGTGAGALVGSGGSNTWNGNITLSGNATIGTSGTSYLDLGTTTTAYNRELDPPALPSDPTTLALGSNTLTFSGTTSAVDTRAIYVSSRITGTGNIVIDMTNPTDMVRYSANLNTYTGTTTINRGTLSLRTLANTYPGDTTDPNYFGINGNVTIGNGTDAAGSAKLLIQAGSLYGEQIDYTKKIFINKSGVFNLLNAQSITGLEVTGGSVDLGTVGGLYLSGGDGAGDVIVNASSGNTATISGTGTSTLSLTLHQGPVPIPNANRRFIVAEGNGGTVSDLTVSARITNGSLTKMGDGLMTISGANSGGYEGTTTVAAGILSVQNNTALGQTDGLVTTGTSVTSGATLQLSNVANGTLTVTGAKLTIAGDGYGGRGALQTLIGNNTLAGTANITLSANSTIMSDADLFTISSNITSSASSSLTVAGAGNTTISGIIDSGVVGVTKNGTGTLILSANNDYTGATTINTGGVLSAQAANALGATGTGTTVNSGGALQIDNTAIGGGANQLTVNAEPLSIAGTGVGTTGALRNVSGNNTFLGEVTVASSALITSNASNEFTLGGGITSTAGSTQTLTVGTTAQTGDIVVAGDMNLGGSYTTAVNLTKEGSGTMTFAKAGQTLTGTVGAVQLNNGNMTVGSAAQLDTLTTGAFTSKGIVDGLASNTTLTIASGATVNANYTATTNLFNGVLAGAGTFNAIGAADNAGITFGTTFAASNLTLKVGSTSVGSSDLNDYFKVSFGSGVSITVDTLEITGDTILDFGNGVNTLTSTNLVISNPNAKIYVMNWTSLSDAWYVNSLINGSTHTANVFGGIPLSQITFQNYNGLTTTWVSGTVEGWLHNEIRPTPEPSTYGAILVSGCLGLLGWRRYRRSHPARK